MSADNQIVSVAEQREAILLQAMEKLKSSASSVIADVMSQLYTEYLPHVETDTESNIAFRVQGCIENLLAGDFESGGEFVYVSDGYGVRHPISLNSWSKMVKPLCDALPEQIQSARVRQLEHEVASLRQQLQQAWRLP